MFSTLQGRPELQHVFGVCTACVLQIEPREVEINEMRETIRAMDAELERYHKSNAGLDLTIQVRWQTGNLWLWQLGSCS